MVVVLGKLRARGARESRASYQSVRKAGGRGGGVIAGDGVGERISRLAVLHCLNK